MDRQRAILEPRVGAGGAGGCREPAKAVKKSDLGLLWSSPVVGRTNNGEPREESRVPEL